MIARCRRSSRVALVSGLAVLLLLLGGCASVGESVKYQPIDSVAGGYAEYQLYRNVWQVYYVTNVRWHQLGQEGYNNKVRDYLLLHAAELTVKTGYKQFVVMNTSSIQGRSLDVTFDERVVKRGSGMPVTIHVMTIKMAEDDVAGKVPRVYDAELYLSIRLYQEYLKQRSREAAKEDAGG